MKFNIKFFEKIISMFILITKVIVISTNTIPDPFIEPQPIIYNISNPNSAPGEQFSNGIFSCKLFSLEFAINYNLSDTNSCEDIKKKFNFLRTSIRLKQYKRKISQDIQYDWRVHKAEDVYLPSKIFSKNEFRLFIGSSPTTCDVGKIKAGSQIIVIYNDLDSMLQNIGKNERIIKNFRDFLEINEGIHPHNYGYKFFIKVYTFRDDTSNLFKVYKLETKVFKFIFDNENHFVNIEEVDPRYYYIENPSNSDLQVDSGDCVII